MLIRTKAVTMSRPTGASEIAPNTATVCKVRAASWRSRGNTAAIGYDSAGRLT
jgi:hypothetical protein